MGKKSRAERRHHHQRMLDKVKDFFIYQSGFWKTEEDKFQHQRKLAENRKLCSCHMCRNPRRSAWYKGEGKLTMQEKKMKEDWENLKKDWNNIWNDDERG